MRSPGFGSRCSHRPYSTTSREPPLQISTATGTSPVCKHRIALQVKYLVVTPSRTCYTALWRNANASPLSRRPRRRPAFRGHNGPRPSSLERRTRQTRSCLPGRPCGQTQPRSEIHQKRLESKPQGEAAWIQPSSAKWFKTVKKRKPNWPLFSDSFAGIRDA